MRQTRTCTHAHTHVEGRWFHGTIATWLCTRTLLRESGLMRLRWSILASSVCCCKRMECAVSGIRLYSPISLPSLSLSSPCSQGSGVLHTGRVTHCNPGETKGTVDATSIYVHVQGPSARRMQRNTSLDVATTNRAVYEQRTTHPVQTSPRVRETNAALVP